MDNVIQSRILHQTLHVCKWTAHVLKEHEFYSLCHIKFGIDTHVFGTKSIDTYIRECIVWKKGKIAKKCFKYKNFINKNIKILGRRLDDFIQMNGI